MVSYILNLDHKLFFEGYFTLGLVKYRRAAEGLNLLQGLEISFSKILKLMEGVIGGQENVWLRESNNEFVLSITIQLCWRPS